MVFRPDGAQPRRPAEGEPRTAAVERPTRADLTITTAVGRGRALFVRSRRHPDDVLPEGVLLVKNTDDVEWQRKAYLTFDVAALAGRTVAEAALTLTLVPTGLGHATFVPDATFALYGVEDRPGDLARLGWDTAPGNAPGGAGVTPDAVRVGTFTVPQGVSTGAFTVSGPALADFLSRARDGVVTFLLVRQTAELRRSGLVHGFGGNHHPTAAPPTLRLSLR